MEKYGFVYIWRDRKRNMYYIGCHWGTIEDGYICSSDRMRDAYRRRPQDFKRKIIKTNIISKPETLKEEFRWLTLIPDEQLGKKYYNLSKKHFGHWSSSNNSNKIRAKISEKKKGQLGKKLSDETIDKIKSKRKIQKPPRLGKPATYETRLKIAEHQPHSKSYKLIDPMGNTYFTKTLGIFSEIHRINKKHLASRGKSKGWTCQKL